MTIFKRFYDVLYKKKTIDYHIMHKSLTCFVIDVVVTFIIETPGQ